MTIEEKRKAIEEYCDYQVASGDCDVCPLSDVDGYCHESGADIDRNYAILFCDSEPTIKDSGNRRTFESGAVRDMGDNEEKGRCDLLPLDVLSEYFEDKFFTIINAFQDGGAVGYLYQALEHFANKRWDGWGTTMFLEVAKHYSEGAKKYEINNWKKGIPVWCYIDSAVRHYLKMLRGDTDEPHDRAVVWNIACAIWTCKNLPELNDYAKGGA